MATLLELVRNAEECVTWRPDSTPMCTKGEFGATVKLLGTTRIYVLRGEYDDPGAEIVRRVDFIPDSFGGGRRYLAYIGGGLVGGAPTRYNDVDGWH